MRITEACSEQRVYDLGHVSICLRAEGLGFKVCRDSQGSSASDGLQCFMRASAHQRTLHSGEGVEQSFCMNCFPSSRASFG